MHYRVYLGRSTGMALGLSDEQAQNHRRLETGLSAQAGMPAIDPVGEELDACPDL